MHPNLKLSRLWELRPEIKSLSSQTKNQITQITQQSNQKSNHSNYSAVKPKIKSLKLPKIKSPKLRRNEKLGC
jgi:hypothetical protein